MTPITRRSFISQASFCIAASLANAEGKSGFEREIDEYIAKQGFIGVIVLSRGTRVVAQRAVGEANGVTHTPVSLNTIFEGGSISKWIASIVVLKQVDRGLISLDVPIARYLPAYRADNAAKLTLAHLMSHQSGVPNDVIPALRKDRMLEATADEAVTKWASGNLQFEPGTQWDYSHSNWLLVLAALQHATGRGYTELAADTLWKPLHLQHSGIRQGDALDTHGMAESRKPDGTPDQSRMPGFMQMAGGFYTNAPDTVRLLDAMDRGKVLSAASTQRLFTLRVPENHYALGGRVRLRNGRSVIWEDGSNRSYRMLAVRMRGTGESVVMMNNTGTDQAAMGDFADSALQWMTGSPKWEKA